MAFVILVIVAVVVLAIAGGVLFALRSSSAKEHPHAAGEPPATRAKRKATAVPETPTVEELEAMLEAPPAPEPSVTEAPPEAPPEAPSEPEAQAPAEAVEPEVVEKPRLRDRLGRTR